MWLNGPLKIRLNGLIKIWLDGLIKIWLKSQLYMAQKPTLYMAQKPTLYMAQKPTWKWLSNYFKLFLRRCNADSTVDLSRCYRIQILVTQPHRLDINQNSSIPPPKDQSCPDETPRNLHCRPNNQESPQLRLQWWTSRMMGQASTNSALFYRYLQPPGSWRTLTKGVAQTSPRRRPSDTSPSATSRSTSRARHN